MVATDTVVGIVGAVVLVAVMAGVFVYEYNNAEGGPMAIEEQQKHFEEDYPGLVATQDIDGDGIQNFNDTDLDGDGVDNAEDDSLAVNVPVSGTVAQATGQAGAPYTQTFTVSNGTEHLGGTITYTRQSGSVPTPSLQATLTGPGGFTHNAVPTTNGNTVTMTFDVMEELAPGEYTLTVRHAPSAGPLTVSQAAPIMGNLEIHYMMPEGEMHTHAPEKP